jgi:hypothetical protein
MLVKDSVMIIDSYPILLGKINLHLFLFANH